jgi:hypothetical protein
MSEVLLGKILSYFPDKGFGFVRLVGPQCPPGCYHNRDSEGCNQPSYFFHISRSPSLDPNQIKLRETLVDFEVEENPYNGRDEAVNLTPV